MDRAKHGEVKVSMWLPQTLWKRAKLQSAAEGRALRVLILDAVTAYLNRKETKR